MQTNHLYFKSHLTLSIVLFAFFFSHCSFAQTPQPYPLAVPENFSVKTIYELLEDTISGNMWVGTEEGLYRYDGVEFQHYIHPDFLKFVDN